MQFQTIQLSKLVPSPENVRKTNTKDGIEGLAANIKAQGLLSNLIVRATDGGKFEVVAGGRRLAALKHLAKTEKQDEDKSQIPCSVIEGDEDAHEISLSEIEMRAAMHPADQFEAFRKLADEGQGSDTIAAKFGVTPRVVEQRLKLAVVSPKLIKAYRDEGMTLEHLMAFMLTDDHKAQETAWKALGKYEREDAEDGPGAIREMLTEAHIDAARDKLARFVGIADYEKAGGQVLRDLFDDESKGYLTDAALLNQLATAKFENIANSLRGDGWKWVEIRPGAEYHELQKFGRLKDDYGNAKYTKAEMAKSGCIITLGHGDKADIKRGLLKPEDMKAIKAEAKGQEGEGGGCRHAEGERPHGVNGLAGRDPHHAPHSRPASQAGREPEGCIGRYHSSIGDRHIARWRWGWPQHDQDQRARADHSCRRQSRYKGQSCHCRTRVHSRSI